MRGSIFFLLRIFFPLNSIVFYINLLLINRIYSRETSLSREDTTPAEVAPIMLELINQNYQGENGKNFMYSKKFRDYTLEMELLFLNFSPEKINIDKYNLKDKIFSYLNIFMDIIFSLKVTRNKKYMNNDGVYLTYNSKSNSPNISFQLKNIYSGIYIDYIDFEKQANNTYKHKTTKSPEIIIDNSTYKYPEKIIKFLTENEKEIGLFIYESFDKYLTNITDHYPKADGILLYETVVENIMSDKTFSIDETGNNDKIVFKEFKEEKIYEQYGIIIFSNITIKFDIVAGSYYYFPYEEIIPNITYAMNGFSFDYIDIKIQNLSLKSILESTFNIVIKKVIFFIETENINQ